MSHTAPVKRACFLLACAFAASAQASYGQFRLEGIAFFVVFMLTVGHGLLVDGALFVRLFRYRAAVVVGSIVGVALALLFLGLAASRSEREPLFKLFSGGSGPVVLLLIGAIFLPFIVAAPLAQHRALRDGQRWPGWLGMLMGLQLALLPGFTFFAVTDHYFWQREYAAAQALGSQVQAGGFGELLQRAGQQRERVWGTPWTYPWTLDATTSASAWPLGLALGVDASAPIAANTPLGEADRAALQTLIEKHWLGYAAPHLRAKLLWDALEPGSFAALLAPQGVDQGITVAEEVIPVLLERLEKDGDARLCPGGRMMDADRAVLSALVLKKGNLWNTEKRAYEMHPDWQRYQQRLERLCLAPA